MDMEKESELTSKQRKFIMLPLLIGGFIALLNETLLNVAFPQLEDSLNVSTSTVQWLATAYMLIVGILVPVVAFLLKTFSTKKLYLMAMTLFIFGTIGCSFSQSFLALLIFRMIQGAGTGMLIPILMDTVLEIYPPAKRGAALGMSMIVVVVAPGVGPTLSGLVLQYFNWHWLFFLILPIALFTTTLGLFTLKNVTAVTKPKIDILSVILSTIGFGGLIFGICSIENLGFFNAVVLISLVCGIVGLILFAKRQSVLKQPMLELRSFRYPMFTLGTVIIFITYMMPFAINIILPTFMQSALGMAPFQAGLALLPGCLVNVVLTPLSGRIYDKIGGRLPIIIGFVALIITMFGFSRVSESTTFIVIVVFQVCMSLGISMISTPAQTNSLNQLPKEYNVHGVAIINTIQQIAAAFGSSVFIGLMGTVKEKHLEEFENPDISQQHAAIVSGVDMAFTVALILVVIGLVLSFFIKQDRKEQFISNL